MPHPEGLLGVLLVAGLSCLAAWIIREATVVGRKGEQVQGGHGTWTRLRDDHDDDDDC